MGQVANGWLQTFTGKAFYPLDPREEDICIEDIAHGLAGTFRFAAQMRKRYTVAEHSCHVAAMCSPENALYGLLHDASEAYLGDVPRPLKHLPELAAYRQAEARLQSAIYRRFGLPPFEPAEVKRFDTILLGIEARDLMQPLTRPEEWDWCIGPVRDHKLFMQQCWSVNEAEAAFLSMFEELGASCRK